MGAFGHNEPSGSGSRSRGLRAARRLEESLGLVRRARTHVGRRAPNASSRKPHRRARRQLTKLAGLLETLQRQVLERGVPVEGLARLQAALDPLDAALRATVASETRTRVFKRVRKAAKQARHAIET